ncbi:hypothetical protein [Raineya sp.]|jgi:hypothetical protein
MKKLVFLFSTTLLAFSVMAQNSVMDYYKAQEKALKDPNQPGGAFKKVIPIKQDVKNGFISYKTEPPMYYILGATDARTDMAYFFAKNGKKFAVSATTSKVEGMGWQGETPTFYQLAKGELINITEEFISLERNNEVLNAIPEGRTVFTKIPQIGTTIQIGSIDPKIGESSFRIAYEMQFNVNDGTFKWVKK